MLDIAHGDVALSKHLKNSLNLLRDKVDDPAFKSLVDEITSGRRSLRDTFTSPVFAQALNPLVGEAVEKYQEFSEEERQELVRIGEEQFQSVRDEERKSSQDELEDEDFSDQDWLR